MPGLVQIILSVLGMGGSLFFLWRKLRKNYAKLSKYYHIVVVLTGAIESIEETTGVIPDGIARVASTIKALVTKFLSEEDRRELNKVLEDKGYKKGGGDIE